MSSWNAQADSTVATINTGFNKIASFERMLDVKILDPPQPLWPPLQESVRLAWVVGYESTRRGRDGNVLSLSATDCIFQALTFRELERDGLQCTLQRLKGACVHAAGTTSSSVSTQRFRRGHRAMIGGHAKQALALPLNAVLDMLDMCESFWAAEASGEWWRHPTRLHQVAVLGLGIVLHFVALYRPGECWHLTMPSFISGRYVGQRAADKKNGLWCQALAIMVRTKADTFSEGSVRHLAESTRSGIEIRRWCDRLIWAAWRSRSSMSGPLFTHPESGKAWTTPEFMSTLVRPCWARLQKADPPCDSTGFFKSADPTLLQSRSFRRGGFQAMRRAKVNKTVRDYMMRWTELKSSNTNQESYDDLTAEDTVRATSSI
jgi:hypothetical protein